MSNRLSQQKMASLNHSISARWLCVTRLGGLFVIFALAGFVVLDSAGANAASANQANISALEFGAAVEREIKSGEAHAYKVMAGEGQYVSIVILQHEIDIVARLLAPDGRQITEVNDTAQGAEQVSLIVEGSIAPVLEIRPARMEAAPGRYEIKIAEMRAAVSQDKTRIAGDRAFEEARRLRAQRASSSTEAALKKYEESLQLYRAAGDRRGEVRALNHIGEMGRFSGDSQKALTSLLDALVPAQSLDDRALYSQTLNNLGAVYYDTGEPHKALECFKQALKIRQDLGDRRAQAMLLTYIGGVYNIIDEQQQALDHYNQAMALYQAAGNRHAEAMTLSNLGTAYVSLGDYQKALDAYQRVLERVRQANSKSSLVSVLSNIAGIHIIMGEPEQAMEMLREALPLAKAIGSQPLEAMLLTQMGAAHADTGDSEKALEAHRQALLINRETGNRPQEAAALYEVGSVYALLGDRQKALEFLSEALELSRAIESRTVEALTLYETARVEGDLGNLEKARAAIEAAVEIIESARAKVTSDDLRASFLASKQNFYDLYTEILMRLDERSPSNGYAALAFETSERARARSLLEMLGEARLDIRKGVDPALVERERLLNQQLNAREQYRLRLLNSKNKVKEAEAARKDIAKLLADLQQVRRRIRADSPQYAALTQPAPLTLKEIQQEALDEQSLLLEYSLGKKRSFLWAVEPASIRSFILPGREEIETAARRVYELLTARNKQSSDETLQQRRARIALTDADYHKAAARLSRMLLGPVADLLKLKRLLIVTEGALQYIPFGALPIPQKTGKDAISSSSGVGADGLKGTAKTDLPRPPAPDPRPLIVDHEIISLPSASVLAALRREMAGRRPAPKAIAILADPVFRADDPRILRGRAKEAKLSSSYSTDNTPAEINRPAEESGLNGFRRLHFSRQEAEAISQFSPTATSLKALDFAASRATAKDGSLGEYRILHFATHGLINSRHPELSGLVLSLVNESGQPVDGFLRLHEIYNLKLNADLVVLSACQTALGKEVKGEGLVGLTRGFMHAGAMRVAASLWSVDDRATAELMKRFYQGILKEKLRPSEALRRAQVDLWKAERWRSPYYWAAFVLQGEWK